MDKTILLVGAAVIGLTILSRSKSASAAASTTVPISGGAPVAGMANPNPFSPQVTVAVPHMSQGAWYDASKGNPDYAGLRNPGTEELMYNMYLRQGAGYTYKNWLEAYYR